MVNFNNAIPAWAAGKTTAQSPISVVNQWTGFDDATDTYDGVHPNDAGNQKMANRWYPALAPLISGASPTASPTASATPTASPSPSGTCAATYKVVNAWNTGFQGEVTVTNPGSTATSGWTVRLTFPGAQAVTQAWNATGTQTGTVATFRNAAWNGTLPAGASTTFGFLASGSATPTPAAVC